MDFLATFLAMLLNTSPEMCNASIFGWEDDELKGGEAICLHRELGPDDVGIAHRDLPCGTRVTLQNPRTGKSIVAKVLDHGPYGAIFRGHWVIKRRSSDKGIWRGCVDLTRKAAKLLGHNGFEPVTIEVYKKRAPVVKWENTILTRWRRWFDSIRGYQR